MAIFYLASQMEVYNFLKEAQMIKTLPFLVLVAVIGAILVLPSLAMAVPPCLVGNPSEGLGVIPTWAPDNFDDCNYKIQEGFSGTLTATLPYDLYLDLGDGKQVRITVTEVKGNDEWEATKFDFESPYCISKVIVKGDGCVNVYDYSDQPYGGTHADQGLTSTRKSDGSYFGISHISFCIPEPQPCIPEIASISLMSLGIVALGAFVFLRRRKAIATTTPQ